METDLIGFENYYLYYIIQVEFFINYS